MSTQRKPSYYTAEIRDVELGRATCWCGMEAEAVEINRRMNGRTGAVEFEHRRWVGCDHVRGEWDGVVHFYNASGDAGSAQFAAMLKQSAIDMARAQADEALALTSFICSYCKKTYADEYYGRGFTNGKKACVYCADHMDDDYCESDDND